MVQAEQAALGGQVHPDHVDPALWRLSITAVLVEPSLGKRDETSLLCSGDRFLGTTGTHPAARPHLHEHQHRAIADYQVKLARAAAPVALDELVPLSPKVLQRQTLTRRAEATASPYREVTGM